MPSFILEGQARPGFSGNLYEGVFPEISCIYTSGEDKRPHITDGQQSIRFERIRRGAAEKEMTVAISKDTPKQAEVRSKKEERARDGAEAMLEYQAEGRAAREKTARLKALRLAAEAENKDAAIRAAAKQAKGAVKKANTRVKGAPAQP